MLLFYRSGKVIDLIESCSTSYHSWNTWLNIQTMWKLSCEHFLGTKLQRTLTRCKKHDENSFRVKDSKVFQASCQLLETIQSRHPRTSAWNKVKYIVSFWQVIMTKFTSFSFSSSWMCLLPKGMGSHTAFMQLASVVQLTPVTCTFNTASIVATVVMCESPFMELVGSSLSWHSWVCLCFTSGQDLRSGLLGASVVASS